MIRKIMALMVSFLIFCLMQDAPAQSGFVSGEFIFTNAPFDSCHASTIVETKQGLMAAWFGGSGEGKPDVGIWLSLCGSNTWSTPVEMVNGAQGGGKIFPCWNPVLFQPQGWPLLLFYKVGPSPSRWWGMLKTSIDGGTTWSAARRLPDGILGPIKNKPIQLSNGSLLCPSSTEGKDGWRVHFEWTSDFGETWQAGEPVNDGERISAIQPSILTLKNGDLMALGRTRQKRIFEIRSSDGGKTWSEMKLTELPNPDSGIDAVTLRDGRLLLVYNRSALGRTPLDVAISSDGSVWNAAFVLENQSAAEFSYPAVIQTQDGLVHITYTWNRYRIKHVVLDPQKVELKPLEDSAGLRK
jgi:predicted neuraminidase